MKSIKEIEKQLKKIIKLSKRSEKEAEILVNQYTKGKQFLNRIKKIGSDFGLTFDIAFDVIIISAEEKYLFNYLSGGFGNKDLQKGANTLSEFIYEKRFTSAIQHLSGRAIHNKNIIDNVMYSLHQLKKIGYPTNKGSFFSEIESLCKDINQKIKTKKGVIIIGVSSMEKLEPFDKLLAHEIFHLMLIANGIWFQGLKEEYQDLDEGLAILLERRYSQRRKDIAAGYWEEVLLLDKEKRIKKIKKIYNNFKKTLPNI